MVTAIHWTLFPAVFGLCYAPGTMSKTKEKTQTGTENVLPQTDDLAPQLSVTDLAPQLSVTDLAEQLISALQAEEPSESNGWALNCFREGLGHLHVAQARAGAKKD
jgi:hypothetical protein